MTQIPAPLYSNCGDVGLKGGKYFNLVTNVKKDTSLLRSHFQKQRCQLHTHTHTHLLCPSGGSLWPLAMWYVNTRALISIADQAANKHRCRHYYCKPNSHPANQTASPQAQQPDRDFIKQTKTQRPAVTQENKSISYNPCSTTAKEIPWVSPVHIVTRTFVEGDN